MPAFVLKATIKHAGRFHPPGAVLDLDEQEAAALGPARLTPVAPDSVQAAPSQPVTPALDDAPPEPGRPVPATGGASPSRIEEILSAIDLLDEPDDFTATGRPKMPALAAVLGFKPSVAEIETAMALRASLA